MPCSRHLRVEVFGRVLCDTCLSLRVLETYHPPTFYLPPDSVDASLLQHRPDRSFCEWKGVAHWFDLVIRLQGGREDRRDAAVWSYLEPTPAYQSLAGWYAVYPGRMDGCWIDDEPVTPQPGKYYGGWITAEVEGPFKGDPLYPHLI